MVILPGFQSNQRRGAAGALLVRRASFLENGFNERNRPPVKRLLSGPRRTGGLTLQILTAQNNGDCINESSKLEEVCQAKKR
jgi:hypothetical protein